MAEACLCAVDQEEERSSPESRASFPQATSLASIHLLRTPKPLEEYRKLRIKCSQRKPVQDTSD